MQEFFCFSFWGWVVWGDLGRLGAFSPGLKPGYWQMRFREFEKPDPPG
jgi:hypothetical protein